MRRRSRLLLCSAAVVIALAVLGGCGGDDDDGGTASVTATDGKVTVDAEDVKFDVDEINAASGDLEVTLVEKGSLEHTFLVEDADGDTVGDKLAVSTSTEEDSGTYQLEPGTYEYYCDIPGHRGQGMEGELVVE
jgi:plastocyanin